MENKKPKINELYSNKQELFYKIIEINDDKYKIQFLIDLLIIENKSLIEIERGFINHPDKKFKNNYRLKYLFQDCHNEALKYETKVEFSTKSPNFFSYAIKNNILSLVTNHMINGNNSWTKEKCTEIALKYKIRNEFKLHDNKAYSAAVRNNWLNEICTHMDINFKYLDYPRIIYAWEFSDNHVYIGLTKNLKQREYTRKADLNDSINKHKEKTNLIPKLILLTEFIPAKEAIIKEQEFIKKYESENWYLLNKNYGGSLGGYILK